MRHRRLGADARGGGRGGKPLTPLTVIAAAAVPVCVYGEMSIENTELTALPVLPFAALLGAVFIFAIFALAIHRYDEEQGIPFAAVTCAIFAGLAFPLMFSLSAAASDDARHQDAAGVSALGHLLWQRHLRALCRNAVRQAQAGPQGQPQKTVEGAIGGLLGVSSA